MEVLFLYVSIRQTFTLFPCIFHLVNVNHLSLVQPSNHGFRYLSTNALPFFSFHSVSSVFKSLQSPASERKNEKQHWTCESEGEGKKLVLIKLSEITGTQTIYNIMKEFRYKDSEASRDIILNHWIYDHKYHRPSLF